MGGMSPKNLESNLMTKASGCRRDVPTTGGLAATPPSVSQELGRPAAALQ